VTRRRAASGRPGFGGRNTTAGAFAEVLMFPVLVTMFVSGVWHGAGYLFVLWGLLHGVYLTINHAWRLIAARWWPDRASYSRFMKPIGFMVTFGAVAGGMVLFRSPTLTTAEGLLKGVFGLSGVALPAELYDRIGHLPRWLQRADPALLGYSDFKMLTIWILVLAFIALALPNTLQVLSQYEPALGVKPIPSDRGLGARSFAWKASVAWAIGVAVVATIGILHVGGNSEFLYWQF
jgi:alginate O-acetyltransferase complex protein AlgI